MKNKIPQVEEFDDRMGVFTSGPVVDREHAHKLFLEWYEEYMQDLNLRQYFEDYWGIGKDSLALEDIKEGEKMRCHGNNCDGKWWIVTDGDIECYECERQLDKRTRAKTFYILW